jgi:octaprenyl-diphosphate synthase
MLGYQGDAVYRLGAVVELIHAATLVHDDIIDEAKVRRGRPSVNAEWGNQITVLMGDWLYMTSFQMALAERSYQIMEILTDVTRKMVEGELIQLTFDGKLDITEEQHLEISMRKTAYLFSACSQMGGILGGANEDQLERLRRYGMNLGIAFQLVDDVLDFSSTESTLGKPVVNDLKEGRLTLPLIYLVETRPEYREMVHTVLRENGFGTVARETIVEVVRRHGTLERVLDKAHAYASEARALVSDFPEGPERDALQSIPDYVVRRDR